MIEEIIVPISRYLDTSSLVRFAATSRHHHTTIYSTPELWTILSFHDTLSCYQHSLLRSYYKNIQDGHVISLWKRLSTSCRERIRCVNLNETHITLDGGVLELVNEGRNIQSISVQGCANVDTAAKVSDFIVRLGDGKSSNHTDIEMSWTPNDKIDSYRNMRVLPGGSKMVIKAIPESCAICPNYTSFSNGKRTPCVHCRDEYNFCDDCQRYLVCSICKGGYVCGNCTNQSEQLNVLSQKCLVCPTWRYIICTTCRVRVKWEGYGCAVCGGFVCDAHRTSALEVCNRCGVAVCWKCLSEPTWGHCVKWCRDCSEDWLEEVGKMGCMRCEDEQADVVEECRTCQAVKCRRCWVEDILVEAEAVSDEG